MTTSDLLAERYGAPAPWRRKGLIVVVALVVLLFGGWLTWTIWDQSQPEVASGNLTFEIVDARSATARFTVDLSDPDVVAQCRLRAYADDHTLVGDITFTAEPDANGQVVHDISTDRQATAVELFGCTTADQGRPR